MATRKSPSKADTPPTKQAPLTGKVRRHLRALGHGLEAVLHVGKTGISDAVVEELEHALRAHELVKIRLLRECPVERDEAAAQLAARTGAEHVQTVGGTLLLFRQRPEKSAIELPGAPKTAIKQPPSGKTRAQLRRRTNTSRGRRPSRAHSAESGHKTKRARPAGTKGAQRAESAPRAKKP